MADYLKKHSARAKEKLMASLGKADRTVDDVFDEHQANFVKQQMAADKLSKAHRSYVACVKATAQAAKIYHETVREIYEPNWPAKADIHAMTQSLDLLWDDYHEKMNDQTLNPLLSYNMQFAEVAKRVDKRGRKLLDYDSARHALMALTTGNNAGKAKDEIKVSKAQEQLASAQQMYASMNEELLNELPTLYDNRILFYTNNLQTHFNLSYSFHNETAKVNRELSRCVDDLGGAMDDLRVSRPPPTPMARLSTSYVSRHSDDEGANSSAQVGRRTDYSGNKGNRQLQNSPQPKPTMPSPGQARHASNPRPPSMPPPAKPQASPKPQKVEPPLASTEHLDVRPESRGSFDDEHDHDEDGKHLSHVSYPRLSAVEPTQHQSPSPFDGDADEPTANGHGGHETKSTATALHTAAPPVPSSGPPSSGQPSPQAAPPPANMLFKVKATHPYKAEDEDELSFEAGEIVYVIPYDDPEEQDDGWLMGIKQSTGAKGVFPQNFTKNL